MCSSSVAVTETSDITSAFSKDFLDIQATIECGFTLKHVCGMIRTYSKMHRTDNYLQRSSVIWPVWLNDWVSIYKLSGCGFKSRCSYLYSRYRFCFEQGVPWHSGNYRVWINSETHAWHNKNIQWIWDYFQMIWLNWFCFLILERSTRYSNMLHNFFVLIPRFYKDVYINQILSSHNWTLEFFASRILSFDYELFT